MGSAAHTEDSLQNTGTDGAALRQVASERLAEHRRRRFQARTGQLTFEPESAESEAPQQRRRNGASRIKDAVAARYQQSVSYHEFLAQEAERVLQQAQAEAEVAQRTVKAVADAQIQLLEELEQWKLAELGPREAMQARAQSQARGNLASAMADIVEAATEAMHLHPRVEMVPAAEPSAPPTLTVRLYEELSAAPHNHGLRRNDLLHTGDENEARELDDEIAFRMAPEFEAQLPPEPVSVSGNVIEFPRQLVATRKARPRIAEGPLRDESPPQPQLRIFEVEPEQISAAPAEVTGAPEWQSILLETTASAQPLVQSAAQLPYAMQPQTAPMELRLMAVTVDACCVITAFVAFVSVAVKLAGPALNALPLPMAGAAGACVLAMLFAAYHLLFFTFAEATPGMRYARIALCTFGDANPTRKAMRRRILAMAVAAIPAGLGFIWAWMDEDGLGWHDRMSRMYQRGY